MTSTSRNHIQGRYAGHSFSFHQRENKNLLALKVSHRNVCRPNSRETTISITAADAAMLEDIHLAPPRPNEALVKLFAKYDKLIAPVDAAEKRAERKSWKKMMRESERQQRQQRPAR